MAPKDGLPIHVLSQPPVSATSGSMPSPVASNMHRHLLVQDGVWVRRPNLTSEAYEKRAWWEKGDPSRADVQLDDKEVLPSHPPGTKHALGTFERRPAPANAVEVLPSMGPVPLWPRVPTIFVARNNGTGGSSTTPRTVEVLVLTGPPGASFVTHVILSGQRG